MTANKLCAVILRIQWVMGNGSIALRVGQCGDSLGSEGVVD